ncbi:MAG: hypothetical protein HKN78_09640 [Sphingomonadaceae bacterium]|nr:hypothetical protein [Sphingomonadaceae bacterium]
MRTIFAALFAGLFLVAVSETATAHRDHDRAAATETVEAETGANKQSGAVIEPSLREVERIPETSVAARLVDWLGRTHPMLVHFPIALFPAGLLAMLIARRRPEWMMTARFLIIAGGVTVVPAAALGWFTGGFDIAADETLLLVHRWLGTAIALGGSIAAFLTWRLEAFLERTAALFLLCAIVIALVVQGWFGGALVHGADHLNF